MNTLEVRNIREREKQEIEHKIASEKLKASYAGIVGKAIEPAIRPLGFDWKIGISLVTSFAAREVFVGTMATIYSLEEPADNSQMSGLRERMLAEINPQTGRKVYSTATALSLLVFYAFAMQCMSTLAVTKKETGGWKWTLVMLGYLPLIALAIWGAIQLRTDSWPITHDPMVTDTRRQGPGTFVQFGRSSQCRDVVDQGLWWTRLRSATLMTTAWPLPQSREFSEE